MRRLDSNQRAISQVLEYRALRRLAGAASFIRGEEYAAGGRVQGLVESEDSIAGQVRGTRRYEVRLWVDAGSPEYACTCPVGADGAFCKHCVAVGIAWLEPNGKRRLVKKQKKPAVTMNDVRSYLGDLDKAALIDLVLKHASEDEQLHQRLLMQAAKKAPKGLDLGTYRTAIDRAVHAGDFISYHDVGAYARRVEDTIDSVEALLKEGHASEVIQLAEHALAAVESALASIDDSDGYMGGILERLQELHHAACVKAKPNPEALAKRLFEWELRTDWDTFYGAAEKYSRILGEGLSDVPAIG